MHDVRQDGGMTRQVLTAVLVLSVAACSAGEGSDTTASADRPGRLQVASQGLCDSQVAASEGRLRKAADIFDAQTHDYLHDLARMLREIDPRVTAELLESKQRVESIFQSSRDPVETQEVLVALQRALHDAAEAAGLPAPLCGEGAT
jgi:hypothetical protein